LGASARLRTLIKFARSKVVKPRAAAKFIAAKIKNRESKKAPRALAAAPARAN